MLQLSVLVLLTQELRWLVESPCLHAVVRAVSPQRLLTLCCMQDLLQAQWSFSVELAWTDYH